MPVITNLGSNIYQIDVCDQEPERTSCYLILADKIALIETGPSPGTVHIKDALEDLGIPPEKVFYIIVTHIHLDHSGGAGVMARDLPQARVYVHPRGARHLIDPTRLAAGARAIYGERFDKLFGAILPVPGERICTPADGETLDLGGGRTLTFYHTAGHARHHFIIHDPTSRGVFSGDALGVRFQALSRLAGSDFTLLSTPPPEFDPAAAMETLKRAAGLDLDYIYFTHYGKAGGVNTILARLKDQVNVFEAAGRRVLASGGGAREIEKELWDMAMDQVAVYGLKDREHPAVKFMGNDISLNAAGINHYLGKVMSITNNR
ncbi:MAG: MBL fold metallo-hydrolase [Desulfotomaculaceae bacterium]|nr:MBL fold metallo-hydrolase [Desulfotomaculaceae bacterium]MDD4766742.1 MBL fold metallo-hydrolase [Desulfotomaculaceae bacterium]